VQVQLLCNTKCTHTNANDRCCCCFKLHVYALQDAQKAAELDAELAAVVGDAPLSLTVDPTVAPTVGGAAGGTLVMHSKPLRAGGEGIEGGETAVTRQEGEEQVGVLPGLRGLLAVVL
jgi:hypothetical protein